MRVYHNWQGAAEKFWSSVIPGVKRRLTSKLLKYVLLFHGTKAIHLDKVYELKKKFLGCGVYEVWLEEDQR